LLDENADVNKGRKERWIRIDRPENGRYMSDTKRSASVKRYRARRKSYTYVRDGVCKADGSRLLQSVPRAISKNRKNNRISRSAGISELCAA